jgi:hypothetical protein
MESTALNFGDLDELTVALAGIDGVRSASLDPADLNLPGVLVQVVGVSHDNLAGLTIKTNLLLLVADSQPRRAAEELQDLFNAVIPVVRDTYGGPTADSVMGKWVLPGQPTQLPGISVPLDLLTTQPQEA